MVKIPVKGGGGCQGREEGGGRGEEFRAAGQGWENEERRKRKAAKEE